MMVVSLSCLIDIVGNYFASANACLHTRKIPRFAISMVVAMLMIAPTASAKTAPGAPVDTEDDLITLVKGNTSELVAKLKANRHFYKESPEKFFHEIEKALTDVVDFRRISARVMGKYARKASREQRDRFVERFKRILFNAYGQALAESGDFKIEVLDSKFTSKDKSRAAVALEVTSEAGATYPVVYSMYYNPSRGWLMENMIVNGINVGLAFRDNFDQLYKENNGDIEKVIEQWKANVSS